MRRLVCLVMPMIRLDKYLCDAGIGSRKEIKEYIRSGRVCVNGIPARKPEDKLDPEKDAVSFDGKSIGYEQFHYFMMNKPAGILSATEDRKQPTVIDLMQAEHRRMELFPVGRLDKDTTGMLILTDDGEFAHRVISPKSGVKKRYYALVDGIPDEKDAEAFRSGIKLGENLQCLPAELELLGGSEVIVTVEEGKFHQVKRMLAACGKPVLQLKRISTGAVALDPHLKEGEYRVMTAEELKQIFVQVDKQFWMK